MRVRVLLIPCKPPVAGISLVNSSENVGNWTEHHTLLSSLHQKQKRAFKPVLNIPTGQNQTFKFRKLAACFMSCLSLAWYLQSLKNKTKKKLYNPHRQASKVKSISTNVFTSRGQTFRCPRKTQPTFRQSITSEMSYLEEFSCLSQMDSHVLFKKSQSHFIYSYYPEIC